MADERAQADPTPTDEQHQARSEGKIVDIDRREILEVLRDVQEISVIRALQRPGDKDSSNSNP